MPLSSSLRLTNRSMVLVANESLGMVGGAGGASDVNAQKASYGAPSLIQIWNRFFSSSLSGLL